MPGEHAEIAHGLADLIVSIDALKELLEPRRGEIPDSLKDYPRRVMREYTRLVRRAEHRRDGQGVLLAGVP